MVLSTPILIRVSRTQHTRSFYRLLRSPLIRLILALFFVCDTLHILSIHSQYLDNARAPRFAERNTKRIYIAAHHWNSAQLLRDRWNAALVELVQELGIENVYVSIYESGSYDDTKGALRELDVELGRLGVQRNVVMSEVSHDEELAKQPKSGEGWIKLPKSDVLAGTMGLRRIPFLAKLRNEVLITLKKLVEKEGMKFDTVLFLNDVVFSPSDVQTLLNTNNGSYAAACSLDFARPPYFYDTFALRDSSGYEALTQTYPYFRSSHSRHAALRSLPVPVTSCWNGMVVMPAAPFLAPKNPLRFRGVSDELATYHVEGSECCLIHADNSWSTQKGVWLNTNVKVGYNGTTFDAVQATPLLSATQAYTAIWRNRIVRWLRTPLFKEWKIQYRLAAWKKSGGHESKEEPGDFCLVDEMQVIHPKGWRHVW